MCSFCGESVPAFHLFCGRCGGKLPVAGSELPPIHGDTGSPDPGLAPLKKERRHVTILFADICESTQLIDDVDPEQAVDTLDPVLNAMRDTVRRYGGMVNEVRGDGVMALFGAPIAQEDHALRACHAALALRKSIGQLPGRSIRVRVGLNTGEVVVRTILNDLALEYTAIGPAVHLAARLQALAEPGKILLSARTHGLAAGFVSVTPRGPVSLRGITEPVVVFELDGSLEERSRWDVRAKQGLSQFVGRETELADLETSLRWAAVGYRRLVTLTGPAGVGKSRLVHEFIEGARAEGWTVLEASGSALTQTATYYPIRKMIEGWIGVRESEDAGDRARRLEERLEAFGSGLGSARSALETILELPSSDPSWEKLDPSRRRDRIMGALRALIARIAELAPLVLVFEDLQWMDVETCSLLQQLAADRTEAPLLIVATFRADFQSPWGTGQPHTSIELDGLDDHSSEALLRRSLGDHPGLSAIIELLIQRSGGIPLFLEETLRDLIEARALKGRAGDYRPAVAVDRLVIPQTIEAVIGARLDRLAPEAKQLLEQCSVIGRELSLGLVAEVCGLEATEVRAGLEALCREDFLRRPARPDGGYYVFKHALKQDVVYQRLLRDERRRLHLRVLEALEGGNSELGDEPIEQMGYHAYRGQSWAKAAHCLQRAGLKAVKRSAHREALSCFNDALDSLDHLPKSEETVRRSIRLRMLIRGCLVPLGDAERIEHHLAEAEKAAAEMGDSKTLGLVYANTTYSDWLAGRHAAAIESGLRAYAISRESDDLTLHVGACFGLGLAYHGAGRFREAVEIHEDLIARLPQELERNRFNGPAFPAVLARGFLSYAHAELGDLKKARSYAFAALDLARELEDIFGLVLSRIAAAHTFLRMQDAKRAMEILEPGVDECHRVGMPTVAVGVVAHLGIAYAALGQPERAIRELVRVVEVADDEEIPQQNLDQRLLALGWAHFVLGAFDEAIHLADATCECAVRHGDDGTRGWALLLGGLTRARSGAPASSPGPFFEAALSVAGERFLVPLEAHARLEKARWLAAVGDRAASRESAESAVRLFRALELHAPLREAERLALEHGAP
jgi:class 3 adenylate cyclase/tetratricopeptide (TPR) repeat protein